MTLEEYTLQRLLCKKCGHILLAEENVIKSRANSEYHCEVCWTEGNVLHNMNTTKCAECTQVWRSNQAFYHIKGCTVAKDNLLSIQIDPYNKWYKGNKTIEQKKIDTEIHVAKTFREVKKRVEKERQEPINRQVRIEQLLVKIADSLDKKEPEPKAREVNHHAVQ